jgi:dTDP-4-dehydrorhamnose 3,5-epimerase
MGDAGREFTIDEVKSLTPKVFRDHRGFFTETWSHQALEGAGISAAFLQDNHAYSRAEGTVRGLHFQIPPMAQGKLVRVVRGAIFDVAVDLRRSSPTYGRHVTKVLSAENFAQLWIPEGFAHGYCTLEPDTEVIYKVTAYYSPMHDRGIAWDDAVLAIAWPAVADATSLSDKDRKLPRFADLPPIF